MAEREKEVHTVFKLSALKQLNSTKSVDNKLTLMQYLVKFVKENYRNAEKFLEELKDIDQAARTESSAIQADVNKIKGNLKKCENLINKAGESSKDRFKPIMEKFLEQATKRFEKLEKDLATALKQTDEIAVSFGEQKGR
eukprot:TRINITY_DN4380_c0_g1_i1.p1 TRINITY_DN4380_c0_g1~~TRINITY_DN4380_c0_g1_i1.p1  ORF type:complete len:140 (+),score=31.02 TRINITY_DN4380_c0_g1_i1:782-1201(+)